MIDQKYTRVFETEHRPVESAALIGDEGMALVFVKEGDATKVRPSTGAAGEKFAGVSLSRNVPPTFLPFVFEGIVPDDVSIELPRIPMAGQILVKIGGVVKGVIAAAAAATTVQLLGDVINFLAADAGKTLFIQFMYEPTVSEARTIKGDMPIGGLSSTAQEVIGMLVRGDVAVSHFDAASDFSAALTVKLGADGIFTTTGSGITVPNCTVINAPSAGNNSLVLNFR
jgi:hypothetical protein